MCIAYFLMHCSEWGYERDEKSGNCTLDLEYGPKLDCLTGYVNDAYNKSKLCTYTFIHTYMCIGKQLDFSL